MKNIRNMTRCCHIIFYILFIYLKKINTRQIWRGYVLMNGVTIRDLKESDLPALKSFVVEAWGNGWNFSRFDQQTDLFQALLEVYVSMFLNSGTFGRVAVVDGKAAGAVICSMNGDVEKFRQFQRDRVLHTLTLLRASESERNDIAEHLSTSFQNLSSTN